MGKKLNEQDILDFAESETPNIDEIAKSLGKYDLAPKQRKVLAVKLLPQAAMWSERKKCRVADVNEAYYYSLLKNPKFLEVLKQATLDLKGHHLPEIWNAYKLRALWGNDGARACERILEDGQILDKKEHINNTSVIVNIANVEQKRIENTEKGLNRFGFTVRNSDSD